jgi:transposase
MNARRLGSHCPISALSSARLQLIGKVKRFQCGKLIACYLGLVEGAGGERRQLGHISTQGNSLLCFLLVEAAQVTDAAFRNGVVSISVCDAAGRKIAKIG